MKNKISVLIFSLSFVYCLSTHAAEKVDQIIDRVVAAYGGDKLKNLRSYTISKKFLAPAQGQSHTPDLEQIGYNAQYLVVDIENGQARIESLFEGRGGVFQNAVITDSKTATALNFQAGTFGSAQQPDVYALAGGSMRTSDAVLAYELQKSRDKAKYLGTALYLNRIHETIEVPFPLSPNLTLWVDRETGLISRMVRINPILGQLDYVFSDWKTDNGIAYAKSTNFMIAGVPNLISLRNESTFNRDTAADLFKVPANLVSEGERIDTTEMAMTTIARNVSHVGQTGVFSMFVDSSAGLIAVGGSAGLAQRLAHFRKETGNYKPLAYQIVTHHHNDHLAGMQDAVAAGATLVTVADNIATIKRDGLTPEAPFQSMNERLTLGEGKNRVEIYEVSTIHAARFLVTYVPAEKLIFIADHMNSPFKTGIPQANLNTMSMWAALEKLDLDFNKIAVAHGARIFSKKDMAQSVANYHPSVCVGARPVCK